MRSTDIENFLYAEAELLDERRFTEWLDLLAEDLTYFMPIQRNVKFGDEAQRDPRRRRHQLGRRGQVDAVETRRATQYGSALGRGTRRASATPSATSRFLTRSRPSKPQRKYRCVADS